MFPSFTVAPLLFPALFFFVLFSGCSHSRPVAATEAAPKTAQASPVINAGPDAQFEAAVLSMKQAAFSEAAAKWKAYLDRYAGLPHYEQAGLFYAETLFHLSRNDEAIAVLQPLLESPKEDGLFVDGRLLYAELLLRKGRFDEAVAATFDVIADPKAERAAGVSRKTRRRKTTPVQEVKLYTLRGRIFAELAREDEAVRALAAARKRLKKISGEGAGTDEKTRLTAHVAWRQIETLSAICRNRVHRPERLSEKEFLEYADGYYACTEPARKFLCEILDRRAQDGEIRAQAVDAYRAMVRYPLALRDPLPDPARGVKTAQKERYEKEMRGLIESTVETRAKSYRNLESCNAFDVF